MKNDIIPIVDNLNGIHQFGSFPTSPSLDRDGSFVFDVDTNDEETSGLYYWSNRLASSKKIVLICNLAQNQSLNVDIQFNSFVGQQIVYYTTNGTLDELWQDEIVS